MIATNNQALAPGKPNVVTEGGWWTAPAVASYGIPAGVPQAIQAKLELSFLLDNYALGVTRTFLYELFDEYADPVGINFEDHFGLFTSAGAAKSLATALHSMQVIFGRFRNPIKPRLAVLYLERDAGGRTQPGLRAKRWNIHPRRLERRRDLGQHLLCADRSFADRHQADAERHEPLYQRVRPLRGHVGCDNQRQRVRDSSACPIIQCLCLYLRSEDKAIYLSQAALLADAEPPRAGGSASARSFARMRRRMRAVMKETYVSAHFLAKQHGGRLEVATKPGPFACLRQSAMGATRPRSSDSAHQRGRAFALTDLRDRFR